MSQLCNTDMEERGGSEVLMYLSKVSQDHVDACSVIQVRKWTRCSQKFQTFSSRILTYLTILASITLYFHGTEVVTWYLVFLPQSHRGRCLVFSMTSNQDKKVNFLWKKTFSSNKVMRIQKQQNYGTCNQCFTLCLIHKDA